MNRSIKSCLPGDYIAMKLSGEVCTTIEGLSEGMFWDFRNNRPADFLMQYYGIDPSLIADIRPTFAEQGRLTGTAAAGTRATRRHSDHLPCRRPAQQRSFPECVQSG